MNELVRSCRVFDPPRIVSNGKRIHRSFVARYACTPTTKEHAYRIRYQGYLSHGYILPHPQETLVDEFDNEIRAPCAVVYISERAVGTVRLCSFDTASEDRIVDSLPSAKLFNLSAEKLQCHYSNGERAVRAVEVSKLAKIPDYESDFSVTMALFKVLKILTSAMCTDVVFVAVRVSHMSVYRRLGFKVVEEPRLFYKDNILLGLMACRSNEFRAVEHRAGRIFRDPDALRTSHTNETARKFFRGEDITIFSNASSTLPIVSSVSKSLVPDISDSVIDMNGYRRRPR